SRAAGGGRGARASRGRQAPQGPLRAPKRCSPPPAASMSAWALSSSSRRATIPSGKSSSARRGSWSCASSNPGSDYQHLLSIPREQIKTHEDAALDGRALGFGAAQMLVEARHDLDEIAGTVAIVELVQEDLVPGVAAGAGRARPAEDGGAARHAAGR